MIDVRAVEILFLVNRVASLRDQIWEVVIERNSNFNCSELNIVILIGWNVWKIVSAHFPSGFDTHFEAETKGVPAMPPSISALSPKEEENVKEVLGMRCRAACRPYLQG